MDPLSVAASVVGLIGAAGKLIPALYELTRSIKDAPKQAQAALAEVQDITSALQQLQVYVLGAMKASPARTSLILLEHVIVTLTGCVTTYSELEAIVDKTSTNKGPIERVKWILKENEVKGIVQRLQNHKSSLTLMLTILHCNSMQEAERSMDTLCDLVAQVLKSNREMASRLRNLEAHIGEAPVASEGLDNNQEVDEVTYRPASSHRSIHASEENTDANEEPTAGPNTYHFEEDLQRSKVYRQFYSFSASASIISAQRSTAMSINSALSLADVSNISIFSLPITANEISNASWYAFGAAGLESNTATSPTHPAGVTAHTQKEPVLPDRRSPREWLTAFRSGRKPKKSEKILTTTQKQSTTSEERIFGVPLIKSIPYANVAISLFNSDGESFINGYVPIVVAKLGVHIKKDCIHTEDLFATSGSPATLQKLQEAFDSPPRYGRGLDWSSYNNTPHDAASLLLRYITSLPEPIIPLQGYDRFMSLPETMIPTDIEFHLLLQGFLGGEAHPTLLEDSVQEYYVNLICSELPPLNRQLLLYLLDLLGCVTNRVQTNKMTPARITAAFQPGLLAHPKHATSLPHIRDAQVVLQYVLSIVDVCLEENIVAAAARARIYDIDKGVEEHAGK